MFKGNKKTPEQFQLRRSDIFIINFENISYFFVAFSLLR